MSNGITLTSAMRNNLGALKYLSGQMDITQTRLATGQKVNSAIDNASSFYQARALTNRASDLDRLLDSMGQSIQTINAAISGLEHAGATLEQAAVVAQQAYEAAIIPEKAWFEAQVGENGAVVSTAQELKDAVNSGKETICVYGKIELISSSISLKNNQKLVGIGYFGDFDSELNKFSAISATFGTGSSVEFLRCTSGNSVEISDLTINVTSTGKNYSVVANSGNMVLRNVEINKDMLYSAWNYTIRNEGQMTLEGTVIINNNKNSYARGISNGGGLIISKGAKVFCNTGGAGVVVLSSKGMTNIDGMMVLWDSSSTNFRNEHGTVNIASTADVICKGYILNYYSNYQNTINIESGANITLSGASYKVNNAGTVIGGTITKSNIASQLDVSQEAVAHKMEFPVYTKNEAEEKVATIAGQYGEMMNVYDDMIKDSSYQGINLLTGGNMTTMFNETRSNSFKVEGANMTAENLGITTREWQTKEDIAQSIREIKDAMYKVRDMVEVLGNNLSIIETRMNFTDALTDILQIGADELVLADMNEESANYLALQTRQQLAVNALSLAAQSSSAVLKLF